jgi:phenylpropionate dioxygenase-like ring-hydroxylating dioxygenase large terminal subunit
MFMNNGRETIGSFSVFHAKNYWYIACLSKELGKKPIAVRLWDTPLVLFRDSNGKSQCLLDRCAHRNVPLSEGKCVEAGIQCAYHGWQFGGDGDCNKVPASPECKTGQGHRVPSYAVTESQGYLWVYTQPDVTPHGAPFLFPFFEDKSYIHVAYQADFDASLHAVAENILDVPHTAFLHKGLFRGGEANRIETLIRTCADRVECEFIGEPRPSGLMAKILAPGGGDQMFHCDRFVLPSVAQVEYRIGHNGHLLTSSSLSPLSDFKTRMYAVVSIRRSFWLSLLRPVVTPLAMKVVQQDKEILALQTKSLQAQGGEHYAYTDADTLGPGIIKLLRKACKEKIDITVNGDTTTPEIEEPSATQRGEIWA